MGNHRMKHCRPRINTTSPIMSEAIVVKTQKQPIRIIITQSFDVGITTTWVETVVAPTMDVVKRVILNKFVAKLGSGSSGVSTGRKLNGSMALLITTTGVFGTS